MATENQFDLSKVMEFYNQLRKMGWEFDVLLSSLLKSRDAMAWESTNRLSTLAEFLKNWPAIAGAVELAAELSEYVKEEEAFEETKRAIRLERSRRHWVQD